MEDSIEQFFKPTNKTKNSKYHYVYTDSKIMTETNKPICVTNKDLLKKVNIVIKYLEPIIDSLCDDT